MTRKAPTRRSNAELAEEALAKARLYLARAREDERRAAMDFGFWVQSLAKAGEGPAVELCTRWDGGEGERSQAAPKRRGRGVTKIAPTTDRAAPEGEAATAKPAAPKRVRDPSEPIKAAQNWPVQGLELVSGQVRELVRQGRRLEARGLIVKAEESTGMSLVPTAHRPKWGLGRRPGEIVGPLR